MNSLGIRILDKKDGVVSVELSDILEMIDNGHVFHWAIMDLEATGDLGKEKWEEFDQIENLEKGLSISWEELASISQEIWDIWDLTLVASSNDNYSQECNKQKELYDSYEILIVMFDSTYWEIFSKDHNLIKRLEKHFKNTEILTPE